VRRPSATMKGGGRGMNGSQRSGSIGGGSISGQGGYGRRSGYGGVEEEEEVYGSGEDDYQVFEMTKVRLKVS